MAAEKKETIVPGITVEQEKKIEEKLKQAGGDTLASSTTPDELYAVLVEQIRAYHPSDDLRLIEKAYRLACEYHGDQKRKSGEPYIVHPLCVAIELAKLRLDKETIISGILHDIVEDTPYTLEQLTADYDPAGPMPELANPEAIRQCGANDWLLTLTDDPVTPGIDLLMSLPDEHLARCSAVHWPVVAGAIRQFVLDALQTALPE